jgi:hypothetical protein
MAHQASYDFAFSPVPVVIQMWEESVNYRANHHLGHLLRDSCRPTITIGGRKRSEEAFSATK